VRRRCHNQDVSSSAVFRLALPATAAALAAASGCGGGTPHYTLAATRACLAKAGGVQIRPRPPGDFIAKTAIGGAINVKFPRNQVTLAFSQDVAQAGNIAKGYRRFRGKGIGIDSALEVVANTVLVWGVSPDPADEGVIHSCLKG
jgi:hypothetical protein